MKCRFDDAIRLLVDYGADPNYTHDDGFSAVTYAIAWSRRWRHVFADFEPNPRPLELLLAAGARFGLMDAVLLNDVELARARLDEGADPNLGRWGYCGPVLSVAAMLGHKEIVELLLDRGAELDLVDDRCTTPLMDAAAEGQLEIVRLLLDRGADIDFVGFHTALERAAFYDRQDVVDHLLARGAKRGILDAIALDEVSLLEGLLHQCVDIDKMMHGGCRMITFAVRRGSAPIVRLLLNRGAAHSASFEHHPLLTEAAIHGHAHIAKLLIDRGANLHATGKDGRTALSWAIEKGHQTVVECLRHAGTSR